MIQSLLLAIYFFTINQVTFGVLFAILCVVQFIIVIVKSIMEHLS